MGPRGKNALYIAAALWIAVGTAWYCYAFARDFYAANRHAIDAFLGKAGL